jgi:hypothetical protein
MEAFMAVSEIRVIDVKERILEDNDSAAEAVRSRMREKKGISDKSDGFTRGRKDDASRAARSGR